MQCITFKSTLLKIKVLHDATEEPFCLNGSIKNLLTSEEPFCFTKGSLWRKKVLQIIKGIKEMVPLTEWFFVECKSVTFLNFVEQIQLLIIKMY